MTVLGKVEQDRVGDVQVEREGDRGGPGAEARGYTVTLKSYMAVDGIGW
jgi:hypothetical protein